MYALNNINVQLIIYKRACETHVIRQHNENYLYIKQIWLSSNYSISQKFYKQLMWERDIKVFKQICNIISDHAL